MNLLVISSWFPYPPDNGSRLRAFHLIEQLAKRHAITLMSFTETQDGSVQVRTAGPCASVQTVSGNPFKAQAPLRPADFFSPTPRSYARTYSRQMQALVDAAVPRHEAAVALQVGAALYLAGHSGIPRVFDEAEPGVIRDQFRSQAGVKRLRRGLTWWKYGRFLRDLVGRFDRTTVVSDVERQHLGDTGCDLSAVRVVPNGVDREQLRRTNAPRPGRLIYPGSVTYSANLDAVRFFIAEILPLVKRVRPDASLIVTGEIGDVDIATMTSQPGVAFTGRVQDVGGLIGSSAVCVVPLRIGGGTRLKILEAMALGTPVVTTTKGAEGLSVKPGEDILIADSPREFCEQVLRVLDDFVLRARLAANGRKLIERLYTWDRIGSQFETVLDEARETSVRRGSTAGRAPEPRTVTT